MLVYVCAHIVLFFSIDWSDTSLHTSQLVVKWIFHFSYNHCDGEA